MRSHRFYTNIPLAEDTLVDLPAETAHHCAQVLRYKVTDELTVFNGDGFDYFAKITAITKRTCQINITTKHYPDNESPLKIHLYQGIARGDKMDLIIQKAVELGVSEITPLFTERCNVKLDEKRLDKKLQHWQKTIISASEQSGRTVISKLNPALQLNQLSQSDIPIIFLEPTAKDSFKDLGKNNSVNLIIGPEGGFSEKDLTHLKSIKSTGIKMGPRILRTETAGLTAIAILQSYWGDF